jgi:hypothetical protein
MAISGGTACHGIARIVSSAVTSPLTPRKTGAHWLQLIYRAVHCAVLLLVFVSYLFLSQEPFSQIGSYTASHIIKPYPALSRSAQELSAYARPFSVSSGYGLFRVMTGVSTKPSAAAGIGRQPPSVVARPEVVLEGLDGDSQTWKVIPFKYKPSRTSDAPRFVAPHQPRLDWQMWFAALSSYQHQPWLIHLMQKLLQGGQHAEDVLGLIDRVQYPFRENPPLYIRAVLYEFDFTRVNTTWAVNQGAIGIVPFRTVGSSPIDISQPWWSSSYVAEYIPPLQQGNPSVVAFLNAFGFEIREFHDIDAKVTDCFEARNSKEPASSIPTLLQSIICYSLLFRKHLINIII